MRLLRRNPLIWVIAMMTISKTRRVRIAILVLVHLLIIRVTISDVFFRRYDILLFLEELQFNILPVFNSIFTSTFFLNQSVSFNHNSTTSNSILPPYKSIAIAIAIVALLFIRCCIDIIKIRIIQNCRHATGTIFRPTC